MRALRDLYAGLPTYGIATVERDGKWYIQPVRTATELLATSSLQGGDVTALIPLLGRLF